MYFISRLVLFYFNHVCDFRHYLFWSVLGSIYLTLMDLQASRISKILQTRRCASCMVSPPSTFMYLECMSVTLHNEMYHGFFPLSFSYIRINSGSEVWSLSSGIHLSFSVASQWQRYGLKNTQEGRNDINQKYMN